MQAVLFCLPATEWKFGQAPRKTGRVLSMNFCAGKKGRTGRICTVFCGKDRRGSSRTSFLSYQRSEIPDSGRRPDHYPGKGCSEFVQGSLLHGQCAGGTVSHGGDGSQEGKDKSHLSRGNSSVIHQAIHCLGGKGLFLVWQNLHGYRKRRNGQGGGAGS